MFTKIKLENSYVVDIETVPNIGNFWESGYKKTISHEDIWVEKQIMSIQYKRVGYDEKTILTFTMPSKKHLVLSLYII